MRNIIFLVVLLVHTHCLADLYVEVSDRCERGGAESCQALKISCDEYGDAKACFYYGFSIGINGDDEGAMTYVKKSCLKGADAACAIIPKLRKGLEEKYAAESVFL